MADLQQPEIQLAQRLASNEKSTRSKALRKLRKYIRVRAQNGGFSQEELLKLWKGLFYCLWMQDKPLLQETLSTQISSLIHTFDLIDKQLLYLETFLVTFKREWLGIDRLRMDKFYQLVRFMFREMFQVLKKRNWENSAVARFTSLLSLQLLHSSSDAPSGLQFHILDLYMTELSVVGALQLSAEDNLSFIEPFCKAAAKTKDRTLLNAICNSIFNGIIEQAPFAIEDLMRELDANSGEGSDQEDQDQEDQGLKSKKHKRQKVEQINGHEEKEEGGDGAANNPTPSSDDIEPVLQFDYSAVADKLLEWASRSNTPNLNRRKLYHLIRVFRNLHQGIFPGVEEDEEEVSTDEDDDMFASRKFIPRRAGRVKKTKDGQPAAKRKREEEEEEEEEALDGQKENVPASDKSVTESKKKKKKRKKRSRKSEDGEKSSEETTGIQTQTLSEGDHDQPRPHASTDVSPSETPGGLSDPRSPSSPVGGDQGQLGAAASPTDEPHASPDAKVCGKRKRRKRKRPSADQEATTSHKSESVNAAVAPVHCDITALGGAEGDPAAAESPEKPALSAEQPTAAGRVTRKKKRVKKKVRQEDGEPSSTGGGARSEELKVNGNATHEQAQAAANETQAATPTKKKKRKKIPVEFEFEADEQQRDEDAKTHARDITVKPLMNRTSQRATPSASGFVRFQSAATIPAPLYCRGRAAQHTKKTPDAATKSKKVTFGLKNNKTAEFKKTDRSLLLSPDGSSRVPFDPKQKPRVGVLKSPPTPLTRKRMTAKTTLRKLVGTASKATPRKRSVAADFF